MSGAPYRDPAVAAAYGRIAEPVYFVRPAHDLVAALAVATGAAVLDVGTGTGAFRRAALEAVGPSGLVVGVDASLEMLQVSTHRDADLLVVGQTPGLPFLDNRFDVVGASFVLSHCVNYSPALAAMIGVCRPGGRIGITTWGATPNEVGQLWKQVVATHVDEGRLQQAFRAIIPWEEWFSQSDNLKGALDDAGLAPIHVVTRDYAIDVTPSDYLAAKESGVEGTIIRSMLDNVAWNDFDRDVRDTFRQRFPDSMTFVRDVHFGVGRKCA